MSDAFGTRLAPLLDFSVADDEHAALRYTKDVLETRDAEIVLPQLNSGLQHQSGELGERVSERYESLIAGVHATHALETKLLRSNERVEALAQSVRRIRTQCARPYRRLQTCVEQLERMQEAAELLRQTQRALVLCKRLHESITLVVPAGAPTPAGASPVKPTRDRKSVV